MTNTKKSRFYFYLDLPRKLCKSSYELIFFRSHDFNSSKFTLKKIDYLHLNFVLINLQKKMVTEFSRLYHQKSLKTVVNIKRI